MNKFIAAGLIKEAGLRKEALKKSLPGWATKLFKRRRALTRLADMTDAKATRQIADATQALGVDPLAAGGDLTKAIGDIQANAANLGKARARAVKLAELKDTLTHPVDYAVEQGKNVKRKLRDFGRSVKGKVSAKKTQIEDGIKARRAEKARKANLNAEWEQQELPLESPGAVNRRLDIERDMEAVREGVRNKIINSRDAARTTGVYQPDMLGEMIDPAGVNPRLLRENRAINNVLDARESFRNIPVGEYAGPYRRSGLLDDMISNPAFEDNTVIPYGRGVKPKKVNTKKMKKVRPPRNKKRTAKVSDADKYSDLEVRPQELSYTPNSGAVEGVSYNQPRLTYTPAAGSGGEYNFVLRPNKASNVLEPDAVMSADELLYPPVLPQSYPLVHTPVSRYKRSTIDKLKRLAKLYAGKANRFAHNHPYRTIAGLYAADRLANTYMNRSTDDERDDTPSNSYYY